MFRIIYQIKSTQRKKNNNNSIFYSCLSWHSRSSTEKSRLKNAIEHKQIQQRQINMDKGCKTNCRHRFRPSIHRKSKKCIYEFWAGIWIVGVNSIEKSGRVNPIVGSCVKYYDLRCWLVLLCVTDHCCCTAAVPELISVRCCHCRTSEGTSGPVCPPLYLIHTPPDLFTQEETCIYVWTTWSLLQHV